MITAFVLLLLFVVVLLFALASGVALLALRLTFLTVRLVFQILALPLTLLGGFRRHRLRRRVWRHGVW
jgi:hypothetical protein